MIRTIILALFLLTFNAPAVFAGEAPAPEAGVEEKAVETPAKEEAKEEPKEEKKKEAKEAKPGEKVELPPEAKAHQEAAEKVFADTKAIAEKLKPEEQKHFFMIYSNYNLVETVKMVQGDVDNAVEACGKGNPEMKAAMDARLQEWHGAIDPVVKEAEAHIENMVLAQEYAKPAAFKNIFKGLDKTRKLANKQVEKTPVTTKDACEYLRDKMSDTQENFIRLLRGTLISAPQIAVPEQPAPEKAAEEKPAEEKAAEEKASEEKPVEEKAPEEKPEESTESPAAPQE